MQHFNWSTFTKQIAVKATKTEVYNAWTQSCELEKWFLSRAVFFDKTGNKISSAQGCQPSDTYEWSWFAQDGNETGKILETNRTDHVAFTFAGDCRCDVELTDQDDYVVVTITQSNIPLDDNSKEGIRLGCAFGWTFYLVNLKSVLEGGLDLRNKDRQFSNVVNN